MTETIPSLAAPLIVGIGGTTRAGSTTELALRHALQIAAQAGAETVLLCGAALDLPMYSPENQARSTNAQRLVELLRRSDGVIISSPGYHGSISGLIKNALDYAEDMRADDFPYLERRAVGCIACAFGWQATGSTLAALRSIVHALRGWPTPIGVAINSSQKMFDADGNSIDAAVGRQLQLMADQVVGFAHMQATLRSRQA